MRFYKIAAVLLVAGAAVASAKFGLKDIHDINRHGKWHASINAPMMRMTKEQRRSLIVGVDDVNKWWNDPHNAPERFYSLPRQAAAPESFDAREKWPKCKSMSMIRDQSDCGSCWAFGAVESMSDRECIQHGQDVILSAEDMNSCSGAGSCNGGYPSSAYSYWVRSGVVTEDCAPYSLPSCDHHIPGSSNPCSGTIVPTPDCPTKCKNSTTVFKDDKRKGSKTYTVRGEANMMTELSTYGPCEGAFTVYEDFMSYTSGIYSHHSGSVEGGHAIRILGYGAENGVKYWLIANSWNPNWGEKGYFRILRGSNECGIENTMWCGLAE